MALKSGLKKTGLFEVHVKNNTEEILKNVRTNGCGNIIGRKKCLEGSGR